VRRVVSLVPSITETLRAWGIEPVACTRFCEQPDLPHVGGTKDPDIVAIVSLAPDLVALDQEENRREDADALAAAGVALHITHVTALDDVGPTLERLAAAVEHDGPIERSQFRPAGVLVSRTAFVPIWKRPWMTINHSTYGSSLLAALGIDNVFAGDQERYPTITLDDAARRHPDLVILPSEPYPFAERHGAELAVVARDTRLVDGRDLFWWGVRTPAALERLAQVLA
jgi:ABC-type Fe3+-hydroxamate transport system substrate-binding protein